MKIVKALVARSVEACWRAFTDARSMPRWVPGLRKAELAESVELDVRLPHEVRFEYVGGLAYALRYTYDAQSHMVHWEPCDGQRGGVRGYARFEATDDGTQVTYALEHEEGRKAAERALDDPRTLVEAFARFMHEERD